MTDRRTFILTAALGVLATPIAAAQSAARVPRIGVLRSGSPPDAYFEPFRQGLRDLGYVEGRNIALEVRWAQGKNERLPELAAELVRLKVDVLVTGGTAGTTAAKKATTTIPVVFIGTSRDPVESGLVASLARPGGNITGLTIDPPQINGKRIELLKQAFPKVVRVAALGNSDNPATAIHWKETEAAARTLGMTAELFGVRGAAELEAAFAAMARQHAEALTVLADSVLSNQRRRVVELVARARLPAIYQHREFVEAGGLMSYGVSVTGVARRVATLVDKILKGARPAEIPVERPDRFDLVINVRTAKALGVTIPQFVLFRADEVIQ